MAAAIGLIGLRRWLVGLIPGARLAPISDLLEVLGPVLVVLVLVTVLLQAMQPSVYRVSSYRVRWLASLGLLLGGPALILLLTRLSWWGAGLLLAGSATAAVWTSSALPQCFTVVPRKPAARRARAVAVDGDIARHWGRRRRGLLGLTVYRVLSAGIAPGQVIKVPVGAIGIPFILIWGMLVSGFPFGDQLTFAWVILTGYLLFAFLPAPMAQLHLLDPLPISRRVLFASLILPGMALVVLGYAGGRIASGFRDPQPLVEYHAGVSRLFPGYRDSHPRLRVPLRHGRIAWSGSAPRIDSPWGESHQARAVPLFRGSPILLYSPYTAAADSSPEFDALQLSRALEEIYGKVIPPEEVRTRYLEPGPDGTYALAAGSTAPRRGLDHLDRLRGAVPCGLPHRRARLPPDRGSGAARDAGALRDPQCSSSWSSRCAALNSMRTRRSSA